MTFSKPMKPTPIIPIIALLLSTIALAIALAKNPSASRDSAAAEAGLGHRIAQLQRQVRQLETLRKTSSPNATASAESLSALERQAAALTTSQSELEALKKSLDPYGVIQATGDRIEAARAKLLDPDLDPWERAKQAELLKQHRLFDDEAVAAMREILTAAEEPHATAAALVALKGYLTPGMRDEVIGIVTAANQGEKPNPRMTYHGVEALESLLPDPVVRNFMIEVAQTNPEIKVATRAAKTIGAQIQPSAPPIDRR